jgi:hypothetical protein
MSIFDDAAKAVMLAQSRSSDPYAIVISVLVTIRKADGEMTQSGAEELNPYVKKESEFADNCEIALDMWTAMIDQILTSPK